MTIPLGNLFDIFFFSSSCNYFLSMIQWPLNQKVFRSFLSPVPLFSVPMFIVELISCRFFVCLHLPMANGISPDNHIHTHNSLCPTVFIPTFFFRLRLRKKYFDNCELNFFCSLNIISVLFRWRRAEKNIDENCNENLIIIALNCNTFQLWRCQSKQISCKIVIAYDRQLTNISPTIFDLDRFLSFCIQTKTIWNIAEQKRCWLFVGENKK